MLIIALLHEILSAVIIGLRLSSSKENKTCLGRFQDCGRGKNKNYVNLYLKVAI